MMTATHVSFAGVAYLLLFDFIAKYVPNPGVGFMLVVIGAIIPDITWMFSYATKSSGFHNSLVHTALFGLGAAYVLNMYKFNLLHVMGALLVSSMLLWSLAFHKRRFFTVIADSVCIVGYFFLLHYLIVGHTIALTRYPFIEILVPITLGMLTNVVLDVFSGHYKIKLLWPFGPSIALPLLGAFTGIEILIVFAVTYALFIMIGTTALMAGAVAVALAVLSIVPLMDPQFKFGG